MSKSDAFEASLLDLIFLNTNIANLGDATGLRGSVTAGQFFLSLHTADPGEIGTQATNECNYTGYARVGVARSGAGFSRAGNVVSLAATQSFPAPTNLVNLPQTATHFSLGLASSGATVVCYKGAITPNLVISNTGSIPQLGTGTQVTED